jgi:DNA (cytosine-5)-methyltransferase 1
MTKYEPYTVADVKRESAKELFTVISLFAGGGGSSTGYRLAGGKVLAINEFVPEAIATYSHNFPDTKVISGDIKAITGDDFLDLTGLKVGELDILDGSPPCSAFSVAGKREKGWKGATSLNVKRTQHESGLEFEEEEIITNTGVKKYSDIASVEAVEDLFLEFVRVAKDLKPKVIIAENVKGITFGEAKKKLAEFINRFEDLGYQVTYKVVNAADFGVPQGRERTIFICVRNDVFEALDMHIFELPGIFPEATTPVPVTLREAIDDVVNDPAQEQELIDYVQGGFQKKWIELLPFYPTRHMKPSDKEFIDINPKRSLFNMIRPNPDVPCPTITQRGNQKSVSGVFHYAKNRKFTIPELKRIMALPEDFHLTGDFDKQAERIGRMVAPKMMAEIAKSVHAKILKPYHDKMRNQ